MVVNGVVAVDAIADLECIVDIESVAVVLCRTVQPHAVVAVAADLVVDVAFPRVDAEPTTRMNTDNEVGVVDEIDRHHDDDDDDDDDAQDGKFAVVGDEIPMKPEAMPTVVVAAVAAECVHQTH